MRTVIANFRARVREVAEYFAFLEKTLQANASLDYVDNTGTSQHAAVTHDVQKILKANFFLILYNLVEATIKQAVLEIYAVVFSDGLKYKDLRVELQQLWISHRHHGLASVNSRTLECIRAMIDDIIGDADMQFDSEQIPIAGNIDARKVRELAESYGFSHATRPTARGGEKLLNIKTQRNKLAHGNCSFIECGRDHTFDDLHVAHRQTVDYLEDILKNVEDYIDEKGYASVAYRAALVPSTDASMPGG